MKNTRNILLCLYCSITDLMTASNNFWQSLIVFGSFFNQLDWQLLTNLWRYEALMTSNKQLQANSLVIFLTNAVRVLLHVSHRKNMKFSVLHQVFALKIRYFIMYNFGLMFFSTNIKFSSRNLFSFYHPLLDADWCISVEEANWEFQ